MMVLAESVPNCYSLLNPVRTPLTASPHLPGFIRRPATTEHLAPPHVGVYLVDWHRTDHAPLTIVSGERDLAFLGLRLVLGPGLALGSLIPATGATAPATVEVLTAVVPRATVCHHYLFSFPVPGRVPAISP
jgi:hypothetical protein